MTGSRRGGYNVMTPAAAGVRVSSQANSGRRELEPCPAVGGPVPELVGAPAAFAYEQVPVFGGVHAPDDVGDLVVAEVLAQFCGAAQAGAKARMLVARRVAMSTSSVRSSRAP